MFTPEMFAQIKALLAAANGGSLDMSTLTFEGAKYVYDTVVESNRVAGVNRQAVYSTYSAALMAVSTAEGDFKTFQQTLCWSLYDQYTATGVELAEPPFPNPSA